MASPGDGNYREGWINIQCPFCSDHSKHLGVSQFSGYANCWRCGWHPMLDVIMKVVGVNKSQAAKILRDYDGHSRVKAPDAKPKIRAKAHKLPSDTGPLQSRHKKYLLARKFDPKRLEMEWNLMATGPISKLDKTNYSHRLLAPIHWDGERVSFQARDITGKQKQKYLACPKDRELINHQKILYGRQEKWGEIGIAVEGITDVWRLGPRAFATFGIDFTPPQVRAMAKHFKRIVILFDDEPQAQRQAKKLQAELAIRGTDSKILTITGDPGDLDQKKANYIVKRIFSFV